LQCGVETMSKMRVLVIGSGGREHALAWALAGSSLVEQVYVAPGNAGTTWPAGGKRAPAANVDIATDDFPRLIAFARENRVPLTVVGPEAPLADGLVDTFQVAGLGVFGPTKAAARLESSKAFAKRFMTEMGIRTAEYEIFDDHAAALAYLASGDGRVVVKASGLAAGKGVIVCDNRQEAEQAVSRIMVERAFGEAGSQVVIEEQLTGPELSVLAFCDGRHIVTMPPARDHKRVFDGDQGPNTGGMGAFAPAAGIDPAFLDEVRQKILLPTIAGMAARGTPYVGVLYAGLMLTAEGPKVLEYNCRFGDPETQVILPLLESDLAEVMLACIHGRLNEVEVIWRPGACATVVMASEGYPGSYPRGRPISGLPEASNRPDTVVFHAGTAMRQGALVTNGGRVLCASALGQDLPSALAKAYEGITHIHFEGAHFRQDIGRDR